MVVALVVGPVALPEEIVNGLPLCQTPRTPSSQPPATVSSQRGISVPKCLPAAPRQRIDCGPIEIVRMVRVSCAIIQVQVEIVEQAQ